MNRVRALKVVLVLVGWFFTAGVYPITMFLRHADPADYGDAMMLSLYVALGIFLLMAVRNPWEHRSLIGFAAWSSFAHATVMTALAFQNGSDRVGFLVGSAILVVIGVTLIALAPRKQSAERVSAAGG